MCSLLLSLLLQCRLPDSSWEVLYFTAVLSSFVTRVLGQRSSLLIIVVIIIIIILGFVMHLLQVEQMCVTKVSPSCLPAWAWFCFPRQGMMVWYRNVTYFGCFKETKGDAAYLRVTTEKLSVRHLMSRQTGVTFTTRGRCCGRFVISAPDKKLITY